MIRLYMESVFGIQSRSEVAKKLEKSTSEITSQEFVQNASVLDPNKLHLLYIQCVYNVINSKFYVDKDLALRLGMNQFLIRFGGEFDQEIHKVFNFYFWHEKHK